tara:strand:- start:289 stop:1089 length:801 start_codon:yes stop_codon:yes gene_type:complete
MKQSNQEINIADLLNFFVQHMRIIALLTIFFTCLAGYIVLPAQPKYAYNSKLVTNLDMGRILSRRPLLMIKDYIDANHNKAFNLLKEEEKSFISKHPPAVKIRSEDNVLIITTYGPENAQKEHSSFHALLLEVLKDTPEVKTNVASNFSSHRLKFYQEKIKKIESKKKTIIQELNQLDAKDKEFMKALLQLLKQQQKSIDLELHSIKTELEGDISQKNEKLFYRTLALPKKQYMLPKIYSVPLILFLSFAFSALLVMIWNIFKSKE